VGGRSLDGGTIDSCNQLPAAGHRWVLK
jgi:hypothetical protein